MHWLLPTALAALAGNPSATDPQELPNFLVLVIDDLGLEQLEVYDAETAYSLASPPTDYPYAYTPTIASLATNGMRFTQARACPICSPTRATLQSGDYGIRTGCGSIVNGPTQSGQVNNRSTRFRELGSCPAPAITSLAQMLTTTAPPGVHYQTGFFGKVHLQVEAGCPDCGTGNDYVRDVLGYDHFAGIARNTLNEPLPEFPSLCDGIGLDLCHAPVNVQGTNCDDDELHILKDRRQVTYSYYNWIVSQAGTPTTPPMTTVTVEHGPCPGGCMAYSSSGFYGRGQHLTTKERIAAGDWIAGTTEPFLAVVNFNALHSPFQWPPAAGVSGDGHWFGSSQPPWCAFNTRIRAMLEHVDSAIANLIASIPEQKLDNTYIFLIGDNGTDGIVADSYEPEPSYPPGHYFGEDATIVVTEPYPFFGWPASEGTRMKGTPYEAGIRVPLIVSGPGITEGNGTSDVLVDVVDIYETIRELAWDAAGLTYTPDLQRDSISFAPALLGMVDADSHARQCSLAYIFRPNGYYQHDPSPPGSCPVPGGCPPECDAAPHDVLKEELFAYVRRDSCGNLWKLVRRRDGETPDVYEHEFYQLTPTAPYEFMGSALGSPHCMYGKLMQELDDLLGGDEIVDMGGTTPLPVDPNPGCSVPCPL